MREVSQPFSEGNRLSRPRAEGFTMNLTKKRLRAHDDRFISKRIPRDWEFSFYYDDRPFHGSEDNDILTQDVKEYVREKYREALRRAMGFPTDNTGILFPAKKYQSDATWPVKQRPKPMITSPDCALDLPEFKALFYYNLLDWGATGYFAAALNRSVFLCDPNTSKTISFTTIDNPEMSQYHPGGQFGTAVKWDIEGKRLAIGTNKSNVQVWETEEKNLQEYTWCSCSFVQECTITCLVWSVCNKYLVSGCSSGKLTIILKPERKMDCRKAHNGTIVTLKCSPDGKYLASAGSDNTVRLWTWPLLTPHFEIVYDYPARAMAWHPWKPSMLAIGGGIKPGTITLYNANNCKKIATRTPQTKGFVLSLAWSSCTGELVASYWIKKGLHSSRAGCSEIVVLSDLNKVVDKFMLDYQTQVIYLLWSPDGKKIATASTDETLRIWNFIHSEGDKEVAETQRKEKVLPSKIFPQTKASFVNYVIR